MAAKHCLLRGVVYVEGRTPGIHILLPKHRCHSYAQQDTAPAALDRKSSSGNPPETLKIASTLDEDFCCKSTPLTFPSKASSMRAVAAAKAKNASAKNRKVQPVLADDAADWIDKVVKDPLVEIDPATMVQHMLTKPAAAGPGGARRIQLDSVPARGLKVVATSQQPIWYRFHSFSAAKGFGSVLIALGASILLATVAAAIPLLMKARRRAVASVDYASSDEEGKLDLQSIVALSGSDVEQEEQEQEHEQEQEQEQEAGGLIQPGFPAELGKSTEEIVVIPELLVAAAAAATALRDDFQQVVAEFNSRHDETEELLQQDLDLGATAVAMKYFNEAESSPQTILANEEEEEDHTQLHEDSHRIAEEAAEEQGNKLVIQIGGDSPAGNLFKELEDEDEQDRRVLPAGTVPGLDPATAAAAAHGDNRSEHHHSPISETIHKNKLHYLEFGFPSFEIDMLRAHGLSETQPVTPLSSGIESEISTYVPYKNNTAVQSTGMKRQDEISKLVPAFAVGAGAMSIISGVDGALEMVGFAATASFICYDLLWAESREDLRKDLVKITDHRKLLEFLKSKNVMT